MHTPSVVFMTLGYIKAILRQYVCACCFRLSWRSQTMLQPYCAPLPLPPFLPSFLGFHSFQSAVRHFCLAYQDRFSASAQLGVCQPVLFAPLIFSLWQMRLFRFCCCNQLRQRGKDNQSKIGARCLRTAGLEPAGCSCHHSAVL